MIPWIKKYQPKSMKEIVGHEQEIIKLREFAANYRSQKKKAAWLYGPSGNGKTAAVHALANDLNLELLEVNASDVRNKDSINSLLGNALKQQSLFSKGKIILVDEIDGISGFQDRGGLGAIEALIENSAFPIFITANNPYDNKFSKLRHKSLMVEFKELGAADIVKILSNMADKEKIRFDQTALNMLARCAGGDARAAINDFQSLVQEKKELFKADIESLSERNRKETILAALTKIFKTTDAKIALKAFDTVDEDVDEQFLWIDENLPNEYTKPKDLARAYDAVSKADIFRRRIKRRQHWRFLVYINSLLTAGVASAKDEKYKNFTEYKQTMRLLKLWQANMKYMKRKSIAGKIADKTHTSLKEATHSTLPYIQIIFQKDREMAQQIAGELDLNDEEIDWLRS
jgi:replication factor C large subunit